MHISCAYPDCEGFEFAADGPVDDKTIGAIMDAQDEHRVAVHYSQPAEIHIRRQVNPRRVKGNGFYKLQLSSSEDGSQTLCGGKATTADMSWGETRYPKNLAFVSCEACKQLRSQS